MLNWRFVYFLTIGLRFVFALSNSYIHPDEHFQSLEVVTRYLGYNTNLPWEYTGVDPARSYAPLVLFYYPLLKVLQSLGLLLLPLQLWYLFRLQFMLMSWMITDWCLYRMLPTKQERIKAIFFALTSYVTLVYQSHCFSNSIETFLLVLAVYYINELRFLRTSKLDQYTYRELVSISASLGAVCALGVFNRVTFPMFLVFPSFYLVQCFYKWKLLPFITGTVFLVLSAAFIVLDSVMFGKTTIVDIMQNPWNWSQYVVAPLNNLIYNSLMSNLAHHGVHPYYNHVLVNLPQLMGPGLLFLFFKGKSKYWLTTPFLSAASGLLFLLAVPHQELRFLAPLVPLLCCCFDLTAFEDSKVLASLVINIWYSFNAVLAVLMGVFHQGGVVPALDFIYENQVKSEQVALVWWRTYSPPTWMLGDTSSAFQFVTITDEKKDFTLVDLKSYLFDTMGADFQVVEELINGLDCKVYLITPTASFDNFNKTEFNQTWEYLYHYDLDHLDFSNINSLKPGLGIYELL